MQAHRAKRRSARRGIGEDHASPARGCERHGRWQGVELPGLLAGGRRGSNGALRVRAWEGADEGTADGVTPLPFVGREDGAPCRTVARAACPRAVHACRLERPQGQTSLTAERFVLRELLMDPLEQARLSGGFTRISRLAPYPQARNRETLCADGPETRRNAD
jgi:hypothetical protein